MSKINIKHLAKELNLSISTVSRALRDSYEISTETKVKVLELAKRVNYQPNPNASGLRGQKTKTIAVVVPEIVNDFFSLVISGIEKVTQEKGYHVLIYLTHEDHDREVFFINTLANGRVDGVLLSRSGENSNNDHLVEFNKKGIPLVFFDRVCESLDNVQVTTDNYESSFTATRHLVEAGCKKIAYLQILKNISIGKMRRNGYLNALNEHPVQEAPIILECSNNQDENFKRIKKMLDSEKPDGIFAPVGKLAVSFYRVCEKMKLKIPDDVKIISFSNLQTASLLNPSLTTITQPAFDIGEIAAKELFRKINKKSGPGERNKNVILKSVLIKRNSTSVLV